MKGLPDDDSLWVDPDTDPYAAPKPAKRETVSLAGNPIVNAAGRVIYQPWAGPQQTFWDFKGRYALYGGSGFTGKTDLLRWYPWQQIQAEDARIAKGDNVEQSTGHALVLRRETPQLRELMTRCRRDFEQAEPAINWSAADKTWEWPNGYRYTVGHMENEDDWMKYQGWQISCLCLDEGTTFTEKQFSMIDAWVRQPKGSHVTPIIRMGSNPVGVGLHWVRSFFVEAGYEREEAPAYWGKPIVKKLEVPIVDENGRRTTEQRLVSRLFVPARVSDNKSVDQGDYAATLIDKPDYVRKAILEGDWYAIPEEAWTSGYWETPTHVCKPFKLPKQWPKFRACKFGNAWPAMSSYGWFAVDYDANMVCYRTMDVTGLDVYEQAQMVRNVEIENGEWDEHRDCSKLSGPLNAECWPLDGHVGPTIEETFRNAGVFWSKATKGREQSAEQLRVVLRRRTQAASVPGKIKTAPKVPGIRFFDTCWNFVKQPNGDKIKVGPVVTIPMLPKDEKNPGVWVKNGMEHDLEMVALAVMYRSPVASEEDEDDEYAPKRGRRSDHPWSSGGYFG